MFHLLVAKTVYIQSWYPRIGKYLLAAPFYELDFLRYIPSASWTTSTAICVTEASVAAIAMDALMINPVSLREVWNMQWHARWLPCSDSHYPLLPCRFASSLYMARNRS